MRRPKTVVPLPKKWRVEAELVRKPVSPVEVRRGVDTRFIVQLRVLTPQDTRPAMQGSLWNDIRLVETDERGNDKRVCVSTRRYYAFAIDDWKHIENLGLGGSGGGNAELWNADYNFALRRLPHPTRHLELRVDSVWRPVRTQGMVMNATPGQDVVRVLWHVLWLGPRHRNGDFEFAPCSLSTLDEKNHEFASNPIGLDGEWGKQGVFSVFYDTRLSGIRRQAHLYGSKALFVKGWFSINGRWPRQVNLKLPDWVLRQ